MMKHVHKIWRKKNLSNAVTKIFETSQVKIISVLVNDWCENGEFTAFEIILLPTLLHKMLGKIQNFHFMAKQNIIIIILIMYFGKKQLSMLTKKEISKHNYLLEKVNFWLALD